MAAQKPCVVCGIDSNIDLGNINYFSCPRCGLYGVDPPTEFLIAELSSSQRTALSRLIRQNQRTPPNDTYRVEIGVFDFLNPISPYEQLENLLLYIGDNQETIGSTIAITGRIRQELYALTGIEIERADENFQFVLNGLEAEGLLDKEESSQEGQDTDGVWRKKYWLRLSFNGWRRYEELKRAVSDSNTAFMAMKFPEAALEHPYEELEAVFHTFKSAIQQNTKYKLDNPLLSNPIGGSIDARLEQEIRKARFVVADLTHDNSGVYWEAGLAHGLGKPVFYTCKQDRRIKTHFDINHHTTIFWTPGKEQDAATQLVATIKNTIH